MVATSEPGWKVHVGDSQMYIFTKVYDCYSETPHEWIQYMYNETGESPIWEQEIDFIPVVIKKGVTFKVTITSLGAFNESYYQITYNGNVTCINQSLYGFCFRTIDNKSYWEKMYENNENVSVSSDLISQEIYEHYTYDNHSYLVIWKLEWNWKTGWWTYYYSGYRNESTILSEMEFQLMDNELKEPFLQPHIIFGTFFLLVVITTLIVSYRHNKKGKA